MAVYGIDFFGVGHFGRDPALIRPDFSVEPFVSTPLDYGTLHLTWAQPPSSDCSMLQLVRNGHNLPQSVDDGLQLFDPGGWSVTTAVSFTDRWLGGGFYYYTMWGWSVSDQIWVRCSDLIGLVPLNWGYGYRLYNLLPSAYRDRDIILVDPYNPWPVTTMTTRNYTVQTGDTLDSIAALFTTTVSNLALLNQIPTTTSLTVGQVLLVQMGGSADGQPPLQRYLNLVGFQLDFIRTELESLMSLNDAENCSGALLPLMAQQFGLAHEPEIGMQQERQLVQNAVHLYKLKGSPRGITEFCSIMTSYPSAVPVHHGYNNLLTLDDSVFADGIGTWKAWPPPISRFTAITGNAGLTLLSNPNMLSGPTAVSGMSTNPLELYPGFEPGPPAYNSSGMQITGIGNNSISAENSSFEGGTTGTWTAVGATLANVTLTSNPTNPAGAHALVLQSTTTSGMTIQLAGTAVTVGTTYTLRASFWWNMYLRTVTVAIQWLNSSGAQISQSVISGPELNQQWATLAVTGTAPAGAVTARLNIGVVSNTVGELHLVDNIWFGTVTSQDLYLTTSRIPITDFMSSTYGPGHLTFRVQMWSPTARTVELSVWGDNGNGTPVQIVAPTNFTETAHDWKMMTITGAINPYPGNLPGDNKPTGAASYYWIYPRIRIIGTATESHYMTLAGLWSCTPAQIGVDTPVYDYPRDVKVILQPQYSNLLSNTLTTFTRTNPSPPPAQLGIGFDGLCAATDPENHSSPLTCNMVVRYQTLEDPPNSIVLNGNAALEVDTSGPNGTVWFGVVALTGAPPAPFSPPPPNPNGWFASPRVGGGPIYTDTKTNDWFPGAVTGYAQSRPWFDPVNSWFSVTQTYFGLGQAIVNGSWFPLPPQPTQNCNVNQFNVANGQPFNFSVYARYLSVPDPNTATMILGFRWYFPDGTWTEGPTPSQVTLTNQYQRYTVTPAGLGDPPIQASTGQLATQMYPYVRFPNAQTASFLLNSAMLAPGNTMPPYMDSTSVSSQTGDYIQASNGASYFYPQRAPRVARLNTELYRWVPMGSTYSIVYGSGALLPPLDPTLWP